MCANFQPISATQAPLFTNQQLSFAVNRIFTQAQQLSFAVNRIFTQAMKPPCYLLTSYQIRGVILLSGTQPCLEWCLNGPKIPILPSTLMMPLETVMDKPSFKHAWYNNQFALIPVQTIY